MKLSLHASYRSLDTLAAVDLPPFTVLTGVNGAGKTHLLEAIRDGHLLVEADEKIERIVHFDAGSFRLEKEPAITAHQLESEREGAWQWFEKNVRPSLDRWHAHLGNEYQRFESACVASEMPLWDLEATPVAAYRKALSKFFGLDKHKAHHQAQGIYWIARTIPYSLRKLEKRKFFENFRPINFKNDFLPTQLGRAFWDYFIRLETNNYKIYKNQLDGKGRKTLTNEQFVSEYGPKPWGVVNKILADFDTLNYEVSNPEGLELYEKFQLRLEHTDKPDIEIDFDSLSSGERILMALVASIYKADSDGYFPELILLDEVDASLHPSMMRNMLKAIEGIFLGQGTHVILVTHSPTTIALSPEDSIFLMMQSGHDRLRKTSKGDALSVLTQGFVTLDQGLKIADEILPGQVTLITEGHNTLILEKALELFGIRGVHILSGLEDRTGKNQLNTIFQFLSRTDHQGKVAVIWDCDANPGFTPSNNTYPFVVPHNPRNTLVSKGIENAFPQECFEGFLQTIKKADGREIQQFDPECKGEFAKHMVSNGSAQDFEHFRSFAAEIRQIQESA
ncbi:AAA family ATPase [Elongatibacter sediminis]|uniref:ATP-binding protein n=1 Tax=Elongatibacter sediminis TaxID=3119006 RepID=A0AAW9RP37_9GAMM